jgi:hypothetical protein
LNLTEIQHLVDAGPFTETDAWSTVEADLREAIAGVVWPPDNDRFVINPVIDGNGIVPIKRQFAANIATLGWKLGEQFPRFSDEEVKKRRRDLEVGFGYLGVAIVEYDRTSLEVSLIAKQQTRCRRGAEQRLPE